MEQTSKTTILPTITCRFVQYLLLAGCILVSLIYFFRVSSTNYVIEEVHIEMLAHYRKRPGCSCTRHALPPLQSNTIQTSLCNDYATRRGQNQRIIAISLFGPKENQLFQLNTSLTLLTALINDINKVYSDNFTLRIYHDSTIKTLDTICPVECQHPNVDFCDISSKLFIPPKIWRFLPAADSLVDIMMSRDLDSPLTRRERVAVDAWLASKKSFHAMRDHPMHGVHMLGGMWGFRPSLNPKMSRMFYEKIHNQALIRKYGGRADQTFLSDQIWPYAKSDIIVHDSFLCKTSYGQIPIPFPSQRLSMNDSGCFVGCLRPCCSDGKLPFGECPKECRPKDHQDWIYC